MIREESAMAVGTYIVTAKCMAGSAADQGTVTAGVKMTVVTGLGSGMLN